MKIQSLVLTRRASWVEISTHEENCPIEPPGAGGDGPGVCAGGGDAVADFGGDGVAADTGGAEVDPDDPGGERTVEAPAGGAGVYLSAGAFAGGGGAVHAEPGDRDVFRRIADAGDGGVSERSGDEAE